MNRASRPRRLLVISYHFPPDGAVGGLRWAGLSKYLSRRGWEVHVVTSAAAGDTVLPPNVYRHDQPRRNTMNDAYNALARRVRDSAGAQDHPAQTAPAANGNGASHGHGVAHGAVAALSNARLLGKVLIGFPDVSRGWVSRAAGIARTLLHELEFDAVVTSGPPHWAHFAGWLATLGRSEPLVVDMRDPWLQTHVNWSAYGSVAGLTQSMIRGLQRVLFARATAIVANTQEFAAHLRGLDPTLPVAHVSNGIDLEGLPERTDERLDDFSVAYVGTLYVGRNFATVLDALGSLLRDRPDAGARMKLHIAGHMDAPHEERLRARLAAQGLTDNVRIYGRTPRPEALRLLVRSDLSLVLAQEQPTQVPAKIYEAVALGVPTLVITEPDSAAAREARRIGAMTLDSDDVAGMRQVLDDIVDRRFPRQIVPQAPISYEALAGQMEQVLTSAAAHANAEQSQ
jgi:glycosyltransferase involved in cell wall biosynthesis